MNRGGIERKQQKQNKGHKPLGHATKDSRQTMLKRLKAVAQSGQPYSITMSGHIRAPGFIKKADANLLQTVQQVELALQNVPLDHAWPVMEGEAATEQPLERAFRVLQQAHALKRPGEFKAIVSALLAAMREPDQELDIETTSLLFLAQAGPVNIRQMAERLAMGEHWKPGRRTINKYPLSFQEKVDSIPRIEKKLRSRAKVLGIPTASSGRPKTRDK